MRAFFLFGLVVALAGCGNLYMAPLTPEEQTAENTRHAEEQAKEQELKAQEIVATYAPLCKQLGFKDGTTEFANCVLRLYENEQANATQDKASRRAAAAAILSKPIRTPKTTNCYTIGNSVNCSTY